MRIAPGTDYSSMIRDTAALSIRGGGNGPMALEGAVAVEQSVELQPK